MPEKLLILRATWRSIFGSNTLPSKKSHSVLRNSHAGFSAEPIAMFEMPAFCNRDFHSSSLSVSTSFSIRADGSRLLTMLLTVCISAHRFTVLEQAAVAGCLAFVMCMNVISNKDSHIVLACQCLFYGRGGLVLAMGAMWVVVAAARGAAGEVVVGALVSILLVPVVGLVVVAAVLLLLLVAVGAALLLLLVGAALLLLLVEVGAELLLIVVKPLCQKLFLHQIRKPFCASDHPNIQ
ncbi:hypothetical protein EMCRGX_G028787 [Ephydatia muelleri]